MYGASRMHLWLRTHPTRARVPGVSGPSALVWSCGEHFHARMGNPCLAPDPSLCSGSRGPQRPAGRDEARLLRFPTIHGNRIVFTYAGDLYTVAATGGVARRLTSHDGFEMFAALLARRQVDRLHRPVRRQHRGLRHARRGRRAAPAHLHRHARPRRRLRPHGAQQHRHGLEARRQAHRLPLAHALVQRLHRPALHWSRSTAACPSRCRCRAAASAPSRPTTPSSPTTASSASSAPGSATAAAWPTTSGSTISRRRRPTTSPRTDAQDIIPMWHGDKIYFLSDRDADKRMNLYVYDLADKTTRQLTHFTRLRHQVPVAGRQGHRLRERRLDLSLRPGDGEGEQGADPHPRGPRRRPQPADQRQQERHQLRDLSRRQAGPVRRPRRRLHRARQGRPDAQPDQHAPASTSATPSGRPTASRSPSSPTPPARTRSTSSRPTARSSPSS